VGGLGRRILGGVSPPGPAGREAPRSRPKGPLIGAIAWILGSAVAFAVLDPILAAFLCILGLTAVGIAFLSSDWVRSTSFEEREAERVRRRKEKWDAGAEARERDRARWEAHQARRAARPEQADG
jgi:hypothetical protein